jgi:hypothetical protein
MVSGFEGYLDSSFDDAIATLSLNWWPWVGSEYLASENKTIVLGESIYLYDGESSRQRILDRNSLRKRQLNHGVLAKHKSRFLRNFERAVFQKKRPVAGKRKRLWAGVIYHNLVPRMMESLKDRPTYDDYHRGWSDLLQLVTIVKAQQCIVYGLERPKIGALLAMLAAQSVEVHRQKLPAVGRNTPCILTFQHNNQSLKLLFIRHPSAFFAWREWAVTLRMSGLLPSEITGLTESIPVS